MATPGHRFGGYRSHADLPQRQIRCTCSWTSSWAEAVAELDAALDVHLDENTASAPPDVLDDLAVELAKAIGRYRHDAAWDDQKLLSPAQQVDGAVDRAEQIRAVRYALRTGAVVRTLEGLVVPGVVRGVRVQE